MGHLADQLLGGPARQANIGVEGDHVTDSGGHGGGSPSACKKGRVGRAAEQAIQLMKFSALTLPSHPLSFHRVPGSPAMEQQKSFPVQVRSMALVQARDRADSRAEKLVVARRTFSCGISPVREQGETK